VSLITETAIILFQSNSKTGRFEINHQSIYFLEFISKLLNIIGKLMLALIASTIFQLVKTSFSQEYRFVAIILSGILASSILFSQNNSSNFLYIFFQ